MSFYKHKAAVALIGVPYAILGAVRGFASGDDIPVVDHDWSAETLEIAIGVAPGEPALLTSPVAVVNNPSTWEQVRDDYCVKIDHYMLCDQNLTDAVDVSEVSTSFGAGDFAGFPLGAISRDPVVYYFEIRRTDGTALFIAGDFVLAEAITT